MLAWATTLLVFAATASADASAVRQIAAPCPLVKERALKYFEDHDIYTGASIHDDDIFVSLSNHKGATAPSGKPLSLNRTSIGRYARPRHLSPLKVYDNFRLEGNLTLEKTTEDTCKATLHFEISAFEYAWPLAVIDDGYRSKFTSNGTLERLYIDAISGSFIKAKQ